MIDPMWVFSGLFAIYLGVAIHGALLHRKRAKISDELDTAALEGWKLTSEMSALNIKKLQKEPKGLIDSDDLSLELARIETKFRLNCIDKELARRGAVQS